MSSPGIDDLLPPPLPPPKPVPWRALLLFFVPAAALAGGTGLQRLVEGAASADPVLHWLAWSSALGVVIGAVAGVLRREKLLWPAYGLLAPWAIAGVVSGAAHAARPLREKLADRGYARCQSEGRIVCTLRDFNARCATAQANPEQAKALLGEPRQSACNGQACTLKWLYAGPFRPDEYAGPGAMACFVLTDAQGRGVRHWLMAADPP